MARRVVAPHIKVMPRSTSASFPSHQLSPLEDFCHAGTARPRRVAGGRHRRHPGRRRRRLPGLRGLQRPPQRQELLPGGAGLGGFLLPRPGRQGLPDPQHPGHRPGASRRRPGGRPGRRSGGGRRPHPGPGHPADAPAGRPRPGRPRLHPAHRPLPGRRAPLRRAGHVPGGPLPGALPGRHRAHLPQLSHRDRDLRPRCPVHVLLRPVLLLLRHRRPVGQPGPVRPALPPQIRLGQEGRRQPPLPQGHVPGRLPPGPQEAGGQVPEDRGAHEAAGVRLGGHRGVRPGHQGGPGAHGAGAPGPGGRLLPPGLHRRLLPGQEGPRHVRRPGGGPGAPGALRPGPEPVPERRAPAGGRDPLRHGPPR